jgi:hypothetical protein
MHANFRVWQLTEVHLRKIIIMSFIKEHMKKKLSAYQIKHKLLTYQYLQLICIFINIVKDDNSILKLSFNSEKAPHESSRQLCALANDIWRNSVVGVYYLWLKHADVKDDVKWRDLTKVWPCIDISLIFTLSFTSASPAKSAYQLALYPYTQGLLFNLAQQTLGQA